MQNLQPTFLAILFPLAWLGMCWLIAAVGGWAILASLYRAPEDFELDPAARFRFRSIQLRRSALFPARYSNSITIGLTDAGLYLLPLILFRFGHPPLLIPWRDIRECKDGSFLWVHWVDMVLRERVVIRLYGGLADDAWGEWRSRVHKQSGSAA